MTATQNDIFIGITGKRGEKPLVTFIVRATLLEWVEYTIIEELRPNFGGQGLSKYWGSLLPRNSRPAKALGKLKILPTAFRAVSAVLDKNEAYAKVEKQRLIEAINASIELAEEGKTILI